MFRKLRSSRPSHTTVVAYLSLFLVLGGGAAYAADTIGSSDVIDDSLLTQDFKNGEVRAVDLAPNSVGTGKVVNDSLTGIDVGDGALTGFDLAAGTIGTPQLQDLGVTGAKLANFGVTTDKLASDAVTREKLGFKSVDQNAMGDNSVAGAEIVNSSVRAEDINTAAVGSDELGPDAVEGPELAGITDRVAEADMGGRGFAEKTATCGSGEQVISGGASGENVTLIEESFRSGNGWTVRARNQSTAATTLTVHAYCLVP
jgi:hypothetical protein